MPEHKTALERMMNRLQRHADMVEALAVFLSKHPGIAEKSKLKELYGKVGLDFDEKGLILPMGRTGSIVLRLSRYASNCEAGIDPLVRDDVSNLSPQELADALLEMGFDLDKSDDGEYDDDDGL